MTLIVEFNFVLSHVCLCVFVWCPQCLEKIETLVTGKEPRNVPIMAPYFAYWERRMFEVRQRANSLRIFQIRHAIQHRLFRVEYQK
jgi:hypothetical protein